jgi:hypothetical protein
MSGEFLFLTPGGGNTFFSAPHSVHTGSGPHPDRQSLGCGGCLFGVKAAGTWIWPLLSNARPIGGTVPQMFHTPTWTSQRLIYLHFLGRWSRSKSQGENCLRVSSPEWTKLLRKWSAESRRYCEDVEMEMRQKFTFTERNSGQIKFWEWLIKWLKFCCVKTQRLESKTLLFCSLLYVGVKLGLSCRG